MNILFIYPTVRGTSLPWPFATWTASAGWL